MQYQDFLNHIYQRYSGNVKLGLERMEGLLQDIGSPEKRLNGFHVAGTNGKGSVCATLEALALAHGKSVGLNTSPHLVNYTERFRLNGKELALDTLINLFKEYESLFEKWEASFFEISTALAFALFVRKQPDIAIFEVGLGGRLDATNLYTPDIGIITNIGLDHVKTLGGSLAEIAREKAGIIKQGIPMVLGQMEAEALQVIQSISAALAAPNYLCGRDWQVTPATDSIAGITFDYHFGDVCFKALQGNLMGEHQAFNLGAALTAFILYCQKHEIPFSEAAIRQALGQINWAGRMQIIRSEPLCIVDGAHNVHGVRALLKSLSQVFGEKKLIFVLSILGDKDYSEMLHLLSAKAAKVYVAQNNSDRAASVQEQQEALAKYDIQAIPCASVAAAYHSAIAQAAKDDVIIAGGSLFTVGEVIAANQETPNP
ncbi:MAG: bifunctional folylpolyglutamate synthase/dihydrofolate synthase [Candidatus Cloacimonetes bacterium]|nr:bifunctional folylpolyglutamate synthase/dihydrofolate synthase [Candidatus Cloacimonadota bacterium]